MRRKDREITDPKTIDEIISAGRFATIALIDGGEPYAVTLSYGYDPECSCLYFHVAHEGRKLDAIAADPRACVSIVLDGGYSMGECEHPFRSVVMTGLMRVVDTPDEKLHAIRSLVEHLESDPLTYWTTRPWTLEQRIDGFTALAFDIENVTAKTGK